MKIILALLFFFGNALAENNRNVSLTIAASVDPLIEAKIMGSSTAGVSDGSQIALRVTYNGTIGVEVVLSSANNWSLVDANSSSKISYGCVYNNNYVKNGTIFLPFEKFLNCNCDIDLSFEYVNPNIEVPPGEYADSIEISVQECGF